MPAQSWWPLNGASGTFRIVWYPGAQQSMPGRDPTANVVTGGNWSTPDAPVAVRPAISAIVSVVAPSGPQSFSLTASDTVTVSDQATRQVACFQLLDRVDGRELTRRGIRSGGHVLQCRR